MKYSYSEAHHQEQLVAWFRMQYRQLSDLLIHIPNGQNVGAVVGARLKRMGLLKGASDFLLAYPIGGYAGLWLELKTEGGRLTVEQQAFLERMRHVGYSAHASWHFEDSQKIIVSYIDGN